MALLCEERYLQRLADSENLRLVSFEISNVRTRIDPRYPRIFLLTLSRGFYVEVKDASGRVGSSAALGSAFRSVQLVHV